MGHTNSTPNIGLPQFIGTDKPTWLGDVNGAMSTIDTKVGSIDAAVATVDAKADNAVADASGAVTTATNAVNTAGAASTAATQANNLATQALTVANNTADLCTNQIVPDVQANKTAIGTLADLQTTAKDNLVDAINEVASAGPGPVSAGWTLLGTATGTNTLSVPATAKELYLVVELGTEAAFFNYILIDAIPADLNLFDGFYNDSTTNGAYRFKLESNNDIHLATAVYNTNSVVTNSKLTVYYR